MPEMLPTAAPIRLPGSLLAIAPHLRAIWPGREVTAGPEDTPLPFSLGPFRSARLHGREVPVAVVLHDATGAVPADVPGLLARIAAGRIGGPSGLPDPGPAALGVATRSAVLAFGGVEGQGDGQGIIAARDPFVAAEGALDPWTLLDAAAEIRGASRELALLALAAGVRVADGPLAGADPQAAWGAILARTRCADPFRRTPCTIEAALDLLALWKARAAEGRGVAACLGLHPYGRARVAALVGTDPPPAFHRRAGPAIAAAKARGGAVLAWAASAPPGLREDAAKAGVGLRWLEDGFIRSAGLGAAFRAGASFVVDGRGPHFDPARESDLEHLLQAAAFTPDLLARAAALRAAIVARGITKYNLRGAAPEIAAPRGRRRVLVPGQVEDDASVILGGAGIRTNLGLLRRVRAAEPDAFLIYKPHPDIEAGFRRGRIAARDLAGLADRVVSDAPMEAVLRRVDAVHVLTSLTGLEAILRGLPVTCWGLPFYAGWGLTEDRATVPRARRRLTLDELVAGALILYPRCVDPVTELPCPPEVLIERMDRPDLFPPGRRARLRAVQGWITRAVSRLRGWR